MDIPAEGRPPYLLAFFIKKYNDRSPARRRLLATSPFVSTISEMQHGAAD